MDPDVVDREALSNVRVATEPRHFPHDLFPGGDVEALEGGPCTSALALRPDESSCAR